MASPILGLLLKPQRFYLIAAGKAHAIARAGGIFESVPDLAISV